MRLIDADRLLEILEYNKKEKIDEYGDVHQLTAVDINAMISCINNQPTAFDVDKVVEQLKALDNAEVDYYSSNDVIDREDAIDIVRKGGIDE